MNIRRIFEKYKVNAQDGRVFDVIRNKFIRATPEEIIRQRTIKFLIYRLGVPRDKIGIELSLHQLGCMDNKRRADICIFDENKTVLAVIECKAYYVGNREEPYSQVIDYAWNLKVPNFFVVDGCEMNGFFYNSALDQYEPFDEIPTYEMMKNTQ